MKEDKYTKNHAKNQVYAIVHMWDIRKNVLPKYGDAMFVSKETSIFEFSYLCVNSLLE